MYNGVFILSRTVRGKLLFEGKISVIQAKNDRRKHVSHSTMSCVAVTTNELCCRDDFRDDIGGHTLIFPMILSAYVLQHKVSSVFHSRSSAFRWQRTAYLQPAE